MRGLEKERVRELRELSGSKEKKWKKEKKKETYGWKKRQRIRNHNLKIIPQYFHNKF